MASFWRDKLAYVVLLAFAAGVVVALPTAARAAGDDPPDFNKLQAELEQAYQAGNYKKALETAEKMHELKPGDVDTIYNIACMNCLLGNKDKAYEWLEKAVDAGFSDADHLAKDDDFKTIRAEDRFRAIVKRMREPEGKGAAQKKEEKAKEKDKGKKEAQQKEEQKKEDKAAKKEQAKQPAKPDKPEKPAKPEKSEKSDKPQKSGKFQLTEQQAAQRVGELTQELVDAAKAKENWKALALALEARVLFDAGLTNYNVACMYSLVGKKDDAFRYLERAIELGGVAPDMAGQMEGDSDFDNIRKDPRYAELLQKARGGGKSGASSGAQAMGKPVDPEWRVTVPKGFDKAKKAPLIVALHGDNGNMDETIDNWKKVAQELGAILLTPQGTFSPSEDHYRWGRDLDLIEENVMDAIDGVMEDYAVDKKKIVVVGFSRGASVAWSLALRNPDIFRGAVPVAGHPAEKWEDDIDKEAVKHLRIFAMLGADDDEQLVKNGKEIAKQLKKFDVKAEVKVFDGVGHDFPKNAADEEMKALKFVLGE